MPVAPAPSAKPAPLSNNPGSFNVVGQSGVPAMHAALMPNGRVVFLDKVENYTQLKLPDGQLAYSAEYDPVTNSVVGLSYKTNAFCAGGAFLENGTLISVGGNAPLEWLDPTVGDGFRGIRYLMRSATSHDFDGQSWIEPGNQLNTARWYPTLQTLTDGTVFVASGSLNGLDPTNKANNNPTYEVLDSNGVSHRGSIPLPLLAKVQPYYMYPFVHLLPDDNLFVFSAKSSETFSVSDNVSRKALPDLAGDYRTYPNTGGSVLLPLSSASNWTADVLICGGGAYQDITSPTDPSCGRIQPLAEDAQWEMDAMPEGRGMVEGTLLPDGTVLWLNGASSGAQGYGLAESPTLEALIYNPNVALGTRWARDVSSEVPRLYHSVALLLLDGTVMIAGSNPNEMPVLNASATEPFPTEFRVEIYTPPYLSGDRAKASATNVTMSKTEVYVQPTGDTFSIAFHAPTTAKTLKIVLYHGGFVTHSLHMGQRMLFLDTAGFKPQSTAEQTVTVTMPDNPALAPPGPYVLYVVVDGVPSVGQFLQVKSTVPERDNTLSGGSDNSTAAKSGDAGFLERLSRLFPQPLAPHTEYTAISLALARGEPTPEPVAPPMESTDLRDGSLAQLDHLPIQQSIYSGETSTQWTSEACSEPGQCRKTPVPQLQVTQMAHIVARTSMTGEPPHTEISVSSLMTPDWHDNLIAETTTASSTSSLPTDLTFATDTASVSSGANTARDAEPSFASPSACGVLGLGCSLGGSGPGPSAQTSDVPASSTSSLSASASYTWTVVGGSNPVVTDPPPQHASVVESGSQETGVGRAFVAAVFVGFVLGVVLI